MKVTCTGRRVTLKPSFIENAEKRLAKLDKFFPDEANGKFIHEFAFLDECGKVTVTVEKAGRPLRSCCARKDRKCGKEALAHARRKNG